MPETSTLQLAPTRIATLDVSAASGIVRFEDGFAVVADDEPFLALYDRAGCPLGRRALIAADLPAEPAARKRTKPDYEALVVLPDGALFALGSGSTDARCRGARLAVGRPSAEAVDLAPLYATLRRDLPELNVEGAAIAGGGFCLLSRGNGPLGDDALVRLDLDGVLGGVDRGVLDGALVTSIFHVDVGALDGVALSFTDADALPSGGLLFAAAAEASPDTYRDGPCVGSVLGRMQLDGTVDEMIRIEGSDKIEGVCFLGTDGEAILVVDPDDRKRRATLYSVRLPAAWYASER